MITTYHDEKWHLVSRGSEDGLPQAIVRRVSNGRATTWKLIQRPNGWYNVGQWIHFSGRPSGFRACPERNGVKLSGSRTDLTLLSFAQEGYAHAYA